MARGGDVCLPGCSPADGVISAHARQRAKERGVRRADLHKRPAKA
eukprot:SAG22_NODE_17076_length_312_cov_0.647887_1_plen_44_part_10